MTHILEDLTHKIEGQPRKKQVSWFLGIYIYIHQILDIYPIGSMYGVFTYICNTNQLHVGKYTIHGSYGYIYQILDIPS